MSKRTGLGRGLGAFFGDDYIAEKPKLKEKVNTLVQTQPMQNEAESSNEKTDSIKQESVESNNASKYAEIENLENQSDENQAVVNEEEIKKETNKRVQLEDLDMILPVAKKPQKKTVSSSRKAAVKKAVPKRNEPKVKIVEVEKEKFLNISLIEPNSSQPRKMFDEEQMNELAESIKTYGILQPLLVQKRGELYEIIAGERRWRAAKIAGLKEVPVIVREYTKQQTMEIALIENVQREDLNPIEEAKAYQMLIQEFGLKQEEVAERVAKNRATVTNSMRLLKLDERVQELLIQNRITGGHARALLVLEDGEQQFQLANKIISNKLSVREVERLVKLLTKPPKKKEAASEERDLSVFYHDLEEKLKSVMGTKVIINKKDKNKGRIEIEYYSSAELERLAELIQSING